MRQIALKNKHAKSRNNQECLLAIACREIIFEHIFWYFFFDGNQPFHVGPAGGDKNSLHIEAKYE